MAFEVGNNYGKGRPRGAVDFLRKLRIAMAKVEKAQQKPLIQHAVEEAFKDNKVLVALMNKILPDLSKQEITGAGGKNFEIIVKTINQHQLEQERRQAEGKVIDAEDIETKE